MAANESVFFQAREISRRCVIPSYRDLLRARVDECKEVFDRFNISASKRDFEELVAAWTRMLLAMDAAAPFVGGDTPRTGGSLPVPKVANAHF